MGKWNEPKSIEINNIDVKKIWIKLKFNLKIGIHIGVWH